MMGSTLTIYESEDGHLAWTASRGVFEHVLERIGMELQGIDTPRVEGLNEDDLSLGESLIEMAQVGMPYHSIIELEQTGFRTFAWAAERAYQHAWNAPLGSDRKPTPGYMFQFAELMAMLRTDPRAEPHPPMMGRLIINPTNTWQASWWIYDFVLAYLTAGVGEHDTHLGSTLFQAQGENSSRIYDLSAWSTDQFRLCFPTVEFIYTDIGGRKPREHSRHLFYPAIMTPVTAFYTLMRADPRHQPET
jgi:hypothetical protein